MMMVILIMMMMIAEQDSFLFTPILYVFVFATSLSFTILESETTIEVTQGRCCILEPRKKEGRERRERDILI